MSDTGSARISAVPYQPPGAGTGGAPRPRRPVALWIALAAMAAVALAAVLFFGMARSVQFQIDPAGAALDVDGGFGLNLGGHHLLWPGNYHLRATAEGYAPLQETFIVREPREQRFAFSMAPLPGRLHLRSQPEAEVYLDGALRGRTPLEDLELPGGEYQLTLRAPRYQTYEARLQIEGRGALQNLEMNLEPGWAPVSVRSQPPGASILIDGVESGVTPQTVEVGAGAHEIALSLAGYASWQDRLNVTANQAIALPEVKLEPARGTLRLSSRPSGAAVSLDGSFRGNTPLDLRLDPARTHRVQVSAPGHRTLERSLSVAADSSETLSVALDPVLGTVRLEVEPADARVTIDGEPVAAGTRELRLITRPHRVEAQKPGFEPWSGQVTPRADHEQRLQIRLLSQAQAAAARNPPRVTSQGGPELVLVPPGRMTLGSPRGSQGRQSNEAERPIRLTRAFYLATTEVTNAQFRRFAPTHSSGIIRRSTLDNDRQPVARVSWNDAVRYCNWLSEQDGLPPAYRAQGSGFVLVQPATTGYRLPSEAEWEWAARAAGRNTPLRYSWGDAFPPPPGAGNYADAQAEGIATHRLPDYDDGHAAASPVGSFRPSALGLFDIGGNVAEWVHDAYVATLPIDPPEAVDPFGPEEGADRVIRGSSWMHGRLVELRLAYRDFGREPRADVGFRVARYAQ